MWLRTVMHDLVLSLALPSVLLLKQALRQVARQYKLPLLDDPSSLNKYPAIPAFIWTVQLFLL